MFTRSNGSQILPLRIVGSSSFGRYPKISAEKTFNMFQSTAEEDEAFLVPYPGYKVGIPPEKFNNAVQARALFASEKFSKIVAVFDRNVYFIDITYNQNFNVIETYQVTPIGQLETSEGIVYIAENNKPQICISDQQKLYIYDPSFTGEQFAFTTPDANILTFASAPGFIIGQAITFALGTGGVLPTGLNTNTVYYISADQTGISDPTLNFIVSTSYSAALEGTDSVTFPDVSTPTIYAVEQDTFSIVKTDFKPGNIIFHDTYFIVPGTNDTSQGAVLNNTWRLSLQNDGSQFPPDAQHVGLLETKPDITTAIARIPSGGNLIFVMGQNVVEPWFNEGAQLFPYQRNNQYNSDYGCVSAATVCFLDNYVVWLGRNEKSGPIIMVSTGSIPEKITTDGLDFLFSQLNTPEDSQAFLYRQDGHLIYHINFYSDNQSFFYDFNTQKFYNASDQKGNYFAISQVVFFKNQYYAISPNNGAFYIFDTVFYTYDTIDTEGNTRTFEIPRIRVGQEIRLPSQNYFVMTDAGFTIETGEADYGYNDVGPAYLTTMSGNRLVTMGSTLYLASMDGKNLTTMSGNKLIATQDDTRDPDFLVTVQSIKEPYTPRVDLSISYDGGATFGNNIGYELFPVGKRLNKLQWWQLGVSNNAVFKFTFWSLGRVVITNGEIGIRE